MCLRHIGEKAAQHFSFYLMLIESVRASARVCVWRFVWLQISHELSSLMHYYKHIKFVIQSVICTTSASLRCSAQQQRSY